jgi:hypothetical protein
MRRFWRKKRRPQPQIYGNPVGATSSDFDTPPIAYSPDIIVLGAGAANYNRGHSRRYAGTIGSSGTPAIWNRACEGPATGTRGGLACLANQQASATATLEADGRHTDQLKPGHVPPAVTSRVAASPPVMPA